MPAHDSTELVVEFVDELPPKRPARSRPSPVMEAFAAALKTQPRRWGKWPQELMSATAGAYASVIRSGELPAFRDGKFDATTRNGVFYVRYLGERREP